MDYEKKYKNALELAKDYFKANQRLGELEENDMLSDIFPELKESEDERVKRCISDVVRKYGSEFTTGTVTKEKMFAWLEKQGESNETKAKMFLMNKGYPIDANGTFPTYEEMYNIIREGLEEQSEQKSIDNLTPQEAMDIAVAKCFDEQKPIDKVEPKFKVGNWVVDNCGYVWKIEGILNQFYLLEGVEGGESRPTIEWVDKTFHLWTIQDAKDGDVLANDISVFIYAKILYGNPYAYCGVDKFGVFKNNCLKHNWSNSFDNITLATKEQRDLLFQKMKESGYEWDAEKKEPKKIEQKPTDNDMKELLHTEYEKGKADAIAEIQNHAWSEEDESYLNTTIAYLKDAKEFKKSAENCINWLKSLKDRVQPILRRRHTIFDEII